MSNKGKELRENRAKKATFTLTQEQLTMLVKREMEKQLGPAKEKIKADAMSDAINTAMILLFSLPIKSLLDENFWPKNYQKNIRKFTDRMLDYYNKWQNDEEGFTTAELQKFVWEVGGLKFEATDE